MTTENKSNADTKKAPKKEPKYHPDAKIRILAKENPKRKGSLAYKKFALLKDGMTVKEYRRELKKVPELRKRQSLKWEIDHGYIKLE